MNNIINAVFQSIWVEGVVETDCKLNLDTGEIFDIEKSDEGMDYEYYEYSYLIYKGEAYAVDEFDKFDYYLDDGILDELKDYERL